MLQTQVNYWTLVENKRHNLQTEDLGFRTLNESIRHNQQTEELGWAGLSENKRHNLATEQVASGTLGENVRHNLATENLGQQNIYVAQAQAAAAMVGAQASMKNAVTNENKLTFNRKQYQTQMQNYYKYELPLKQQDIFIRHQEADTKQATMEYERLKAYNDMANRSVTTIQNFIPFMGD